jgi:hypothetical protein
MSVFGRLLYKYYYKPKGAKEALNKFGGEANYNQMIMAEQSMKKHALNNLIIDSGFNSNGRFKINFLTSDHLIHQTLFCTYSFFKFLTFEESLDFSVSYYSDGTLSDSTIEILQKKFPNIKVVGSKEMQIRISNNLPENIFPYLNKNVSEFPLFKKLVYPHINNTGLSTFFDSDMLFYKRPSEFIEWLYKQRSRGSEAFCIQDVKRSYGYKVSQISKAYHKPIINNINSGMYSIYSESVDFIFIEKLIKDLETRFGKNYLAEQLVTAILLEKSKNLHIAPKSEYIVFPTNEQIEGPVGTLHHYVDTSKEWYFKYAWKQIV